MFFPISDDDRDLYRPVYITYILLAANILAFLLQVSRPEVTYGYSVVPREITSSEDLIGVVAIEVAGRKPIEIPHAPGPSPIWLTLFSSMFLHAGFGHLGSNMLYLWIFGDNVEHRFGATRFLLFYLLSGVAASFAQIALNPDGLIPNLGASGAVAGVMGAYMVLFPYNRVNAVFLITVISVPAVVVLGMWIATQFISGYGSLFESTQSTGGVAYAAHIGGFAAGVIAGLVSRASIQDEPDSILRRNYQRDPRARRIW